MRRRNFLANAGLGMAATWGFPGHSKANWQVLRHSKRAVATRGTARNIIFIMLSGAPSHVDTFDLKPGPYTPDYFGVQSLTNGLKWPAGLFPKLSQRMDQFSLVRSISADEAVHERAIYHVLTAHRLNPGLLGEIPHFCSVASLFLNDFREPSHVLPTVVKVGNYGASNGFLENKHLGLILDRAGSVSQMEHSFDGLEQRLGLLNSLLEETKVAQDDRIQFLQFQDQAKDMMRDPDLLNLFEAQGVSGDTRVDGFLRQCEMAARVLAANKGTRVMQLELEGWDHHIDIYTDRGSYGLEALSHALDTGLAYLLDTLSAQPGLRGGSLLDETLIVAAGEFGRTTGGLNTSGGRDHFPEVMSAFFAGGGVQPGRIIGASNATGSFISDRGWSHNRYMGINDMVATMFSALGIDWTQQIEETPSGRVFELVDTSQKGEAYDLDPLFV